MAGAPREFKPLKDLGSIVLSDSSELKFYVDEYKGFKYGSIRTFLKGEAYSGPTKAGVTMNPAVLAGIIEALQKLPKEPATLQDQELGRFLKKLGVEMVVRVTVYKDTTGIDIREWVDDETYKGWSKKGVRIPYNELAATLKRLAEMQQVIGMPRPKV